MYSYDNAIKFFKKLLLRKIADVEGEYYAKYYYYDLAINALKKEIPEKPYYLVYGNGVNPKVGNWNHGFACICKYREKYCSNCGQRLDWKGIEMR